MISHSTIKKALIFNFCVLSFALNAQSENDKSTKKTSSNKTFLYNEERQNLMTFSIGYHQPIASGDNFIGNGLKGRAGINFNAQLFVYNQFFIGVAANSTYFTVKDKTVVGNYEKTTLNEQFFFIGYEFLPAERLRLGVNTSIFGDTRYKNKYSSKPDEVYQIDRGKLNSFGFYINYELSPRFILYLDYAYRTSKTDIKTPVELSATFERGTYHNIGIGLTFALGSESLISSL